MDSPDPHTVATYAFARMRRDGELNRFKDLLNTTVCVESDLMSDVQERAMHFFPEGGSIAVYYPGERRFRFIWHSGRTRDEDVSPKAVVANDQDGRFTVGFLVDAIYKSKDWPDQLIGEVSTIAVEKKLALT